MSYVISVLNQKGGSGKTTIATHIARQLQIAKNETILVDSDPQGSARDWAAVDTENPLQVLGIDRPTLEKNIKAIKHEFVIIDGAPQASELAASAIKASDLIVIPVQPSPYDIWAANDLISLVKQRIEITDNKLKACLLISRAITGTKISQDIGNILKEFELPILKTTIKQRVIYPTSAAIGKTVFDVEPYGDAAVEIRAVVKEILEFK